MSEVRGRVSGDEGTGGGAEAKRLAPHDLHVGVVLASEEVVAAVGSHHVFVHRELDLPPELAVFLRAHGQPGKTHTIAATEILQWPGVGNTRLIEILGPGVRNCISIFIFVNSPCRQSLNVLNWISVRGPRRMVQKSESSAHTHTRRRTQPAAV